jgi:hypothetical protein
MKAPSVIIALAFALLIGYLSGHHAGYSSGYADGHDKGWFDGNVHADSRQLQWEDQQNKKMTWEQFDRAYEQSHPYPKCWNHPKNGRDMDEILLHTSLETAARTQARDDGRVQ